MAQSSNVEERAVFALPNGVDFAVFSDCFFDLRQLSTAMRFLF
ncbi:hypothetical protein ACMHYJ_15855 [Castellaniella hirudinis]